MAPVVPSVSCECTDWPPPPPPDPNGLLPSSQDCIADATIIACCMDFGLTEDMTEPDSHVFCASLYINHNGAARRDVVLSGCVRLRRLYALRSRLEVQTSSDKITAPMGTINAKDG